MPSSVNSDYNNDTHSWPEIERQIKNIAEAGFTHIQWIHDWQAEYMYSPSEMFQVRDLLKYYNLKSHTMHATEGGVRAKHIDGELVFDNRYRLFSNIRKDYTSTNEYIRLAGVDLIKNRIDLCSHIGASVMVLHMQLPYKMFEESSSDKTDYYKQVYKSLDEVKPYAKAAGVKIAFENLICTPKHHQDECFDRIFNDYDDDFIGFCYDSGHSVLQSLDNYYHYIEKYYSRMIVTHLQDNQSIPKELIEIDAEVLKHDTHLVPFAGVLDWDIVAKFIAKATQLNLPADFEVGIIASTESQEKQLLLDCRVKADKFHSMVMSYKK